MRRSILDLFGLLLCIMPMVQSQYGVQYLNSYDGLILRLSNGRVNQLHGAPGQQINLEFILANHGSAGRIRFEQHSEDGFRGLLNADHAFLTEGQQQVVEVLNMVIPERSEGTIIRFTLSAIRDSGRRRRNVDNDNSQRGNYGGSYGGTGSYGGGDRGDQLPQPVNGNNDITSVTIDFLVTGEPIEDNEKPKLEIKYAANNKDEVCQMGFGERSCRDHKWKFTAAVEDEQTGLHLPEVSRAGTLGSSFPQDRQPIEYRHLNWAMGDTDKHTVEVSVTCCMENVDVKIRDIAGNVQAMVAKSTDFGEASSNGGMSKSLMYGLIGGAALLVIIIVVIIIVVVCRKRYSPVSQVG